MPMTEANLKHVFMAFSTFWTELRPVQLRTMQARDCHFRAEPHMKNWFISFCMRIMKRRSPFAVSVPPAGTWPGSWPFRSPLSCRSPRDDAMRLELPFFCASFAREFEQEMDEFGLAVRPGLFKNAGELRAGGGDGNSAPFRRSLATVALDDLGG